MRKARQPPLPPPGSRDVLSLSKAFPAKRSIGGAEDAPARLHPCSQGGEDGMGRGDAGMGRGWDGGMRGRDEERLGWREERLGWRDERLGWGHERQLGWRMRSWDGGDEAGTKDERPGWDQKAAPSCLFPTHPGMHPSFSGSRASLQPPRHMSAPGINTQTKNLKAKSKCGLKQKIWGFSPSLLQA